MSGAHKARLIITARRPDRNPIGQNTGPEEAPTPALLAHWDGVNLPEPILSPVWWLPGGARAGLAMARGLALPKLCHETFDLGKRFEPGLLCLPPPIALPWNARRIDKIELARAPDLEALGQS